MSQFGRVFIIQRQLQISRDVFRVAELFGHVEGGQVSDTGHANPPKVCIIHRHLP